MKVLPVPTGPWQLQPKQEILLVNVLFVVVKSEPGTAALVELRYCRFGRRNTDNCAEPQPIPFYVSPEADLLGMLAVHGRSAIEQRLFQYMYFTNR